MGKYGNNKKGLEMPSAPGWLVTYGDIMSLLLTFFVLLISYSSIREEAFRRSISSFQEAIGVLPEETSVIHFEEIPAVRAMPLISPHEIIRRLQKATSANVIGSGLDVRAEREGVRLIIQSPILFDSAKADLRPEALALLDELAKILAENPVEVVVEGHTDNLPIHTEQFPSNWELSTARAISVSRYLFMRGSLDARRFTVAGYAEFHPLASNETAEGRQKNRRVEILLKDVAK